MQARLKLTDKVADVISTSPYDVLKLNSMLNFVFCV